MQLSTLKDVYRHTGPFVTVHLDVSRNTEDAAIAVLPAEQGKGGGVAAVLRWDDRDDKQETV